jgi:PiT family inorganic phosphate transporter
VGEALAKTAYFLEMTPLSGAISWSPQNHAANGSRLQWGTLRSLAMVCGLTLPSSFILSAFWFWLFRQLV